jgi:hypothetical protein
MAYGTATTRLFRSFGLCFGFLTSSPMELSALLMNFETRFSQLRAKFCRYFQTDRRFHFLIFFRG